MHKWSTLKQKVCPACRHYESTTETCALMTAGLTGAHLKELFHGQRCDSERFLGSFATHYLTAKYGSEFLDDAEATAAELLDEICSAEGPPGMARGSVDDLPSFREWLMSCARDIITRKLERLYAHPMCGICHHYSQSQASVCRLQRVPDTNGASQPHPWFAHKLRPRQDPAALDPPCAQFESSKRTAYLHAVTPPAYPELNGQVARNPFDLLRAEELEPMLNSLLERLERRSLRIEYIIRKVYLYNTAPEEVARELGTQGWIIRRELEQSYEVLQQLLTQNKLHGLDQPKL